MARLIEKNSNYIVSIEMREWKDGQYTNDWSNDFFEVGNLPYDEEHDAYIVDDTDYCVQYAKDWQYSEGDFQDDEKNENRMVVVEEGIE